jgi:protein-histidine pros-kinase
VEKEGQRVRDKFFASIAHELRTPLNSINPIIRLIIDLLQAPTINVPQLLQSLKVIQNSATHLESLIEDALDLFRLQNNTFKLNPEMLEVRPLLQGVIDIMKFQS